MSKPFTVTKERLKILKLLHYWQFATTSQIWQHHQATKKIQNTQRDLKVLSDMGLVRSFPVNAELGRASELCWLITRAGVEGTLGKTYGTQFARKPARDHIEFRGVELLLVRKVLREARSKGDKWQLFLPNKFNQANPKPDSLWDRTPQTVHLIKSVAWVEGIFSPADYAPGKMDWQGKQVIFTDERLSSIEHQIRGSAVAPNIPSALNDYMAVLETEKDYIAIPIILAHPRAGRKFWNSRYELYRKLGHSEYAVPLVIFSDEAEFTDIKDELRKHSLTAAPINKTVLALNKARTTLYNQKDYLRAVRSSRR